MTDQIDAMGTSEYAEDFIIGAWLYGEHREHLRIFHQDDFIARKSLFRVMKKLRTWDDPIALSEATKEEGTHTSIAELLPLTEDYIKTPNRDEYYRGYAKKILFESMGEYVLRSGKDPKKIEDYLDKIKIIYASETVRTEDNKDWLTNYLNELDRRKDQKPLKYDLHPLNSKLTGLKQGELTTIAARPGVGKSTFALQTAEHIANGGHKVLYFNLEMTMNQIADRLVLKHTDIQQTKLQEGEVTREEWEKIAVLLDKIKPIQDNISFKTKNSNVDYFYKIVEEENPELVIVDQLSHLTTNAPASSIRESYIHIVEALKKIAIEYNIPVLLLAQLNRNADKPGGNPSLVDLKESGIIEETSDNVLLIYPLKEDAEEGQYKPTIQCFIEIAKNRQGEQGTVPVIFRKNKCCFTEQADYKEPARTSAKRR